LPIILNIAASSENIDEWRTAPAVIDETVRIVKIFLESHREEIRLSVHGRSDQEIGADIIAEFLGWKESRIRHSLERLGLIDRGELDSELKEEHALRYAPPKSSLPLKEVVIGRRSWAEARLGELLKGIPAKYVSSGRGTIEKQPSLPPGIDKKTSHEPGGSRIRTARGKKVF